MQNIVFRIPEKIIIGYSEMDSVIDTLNKRNIEHILVLLDHNIKEIEPINIFFNKLKNTKISYSIFDKIYSEPSISLVDKIIKEYQPTVHFQAVIGIGGGSTLDIAKILAISNNTKNTIKEHVGIELLEDRGIFTILIPTTSGTGAEATPNAIVKDEEEECKKAIVSSYLIPDLVVIDPELTITLPAKITAETGIDAFTHAIECFICKKSNPMSDLFSLEAIKLISNNILNAVKNGEDREARYNMSLASLYGGIAITNSGTGAIHALAYPLGGKYGISHGLSNAVLINEVLEYNAETVSDKYREVAKAMGAEINNFTKDESVEFVINTVRGIVNDVGIKLMDDFQITEKIIKDLANSAMSVERLLKNNPRPVSYDDAVAIYKKAFKK